MRSCTSTSKLIITCCLFDFDDDLDFSGPEYKMEYLCFWCLYCKNNNWGTKPERFERIIKAIAQSELKDSLKTIHLCASNVTSEQVSKMLKDNNIEHISILTSSVTDLFVQ